MLEMWDKAFTSDGMWQRLLGTARLDFQVGDKGLVKAMMGGKGSKRMGERWFFLGFLVKNREAN